MRRLGVIAALPRELLPLVEGWRAAEARDRGQRVWRGAIGSTECIAICSGMGKDAAARSCSFAENFGHLDGLISFGWAGAISCGMQGGQAYTVDEVIDAATGQRFAATGLGAPSAPRAGTPLRLLTIDHVAQAEEKRALAERFRAVLVDMEAATVAAAASAKGIAFYCLKGVSDTPGDKLPDFSRFTDVAGGLRMRAVLAYLAVRPKYWRSIADMSKNSKAGAEAAACALRELVEHHANQANG